MLVPYLYIFVLFDNATEQILWSTMISKHLFYAIAFCAMLAIPYNPVYAAQKSMLNTVAFNTYSHILTKNILPARLLENNIVRRTVYFILGTAAVITAKKVAKSFIRCITDARLITLVDKYIAWEKCTNNNNLNNLLQEWHQTIPQLKFYHYWDDIEQYSTKWTLTSRTRFVRRIVRTILHYAGKESTTVDEIDNLFTSLLSYIDKDIVNNAMKDCYTVIMPENVEIITRMYLNQGAAVRKLLQDKELSIRFHWWGLDPYPEINNDPF